MQKKIILFAAIALVVACSKDNSNSEPEINFNQSLVKLKYDEDFQFTVPNSKVTSLQSSDEFVGIIESNGLFKAKHIGETKITGLVDDKIVSAKVIVEPYVTGITEPYLSFGATKATVKNNEKRLLISDTYEGVLYRGQGDKENEIFYTFENGLLKNSILTFKKYSNIVKDLPIFYSERYNFDAYANDTYYFKNKSHVVALNWTSSGTYSARYYSLSSK